MEILLLCLQIINFYSSLCYTNYLRISALPFNFLRLCVCVCLREKERGRGRERGITSLKVSAE